MTAQLHQFPTDADRLATIAKEIRHELEAASQSALESAIRIGEHLLEAKKIAGHGNFIPWLEQNFKSVYRQAAKYMSAANNAEKLRANVNCQFTFSLDKIPALLALPDEPEDAVERPIHTKKSTPAAKRQKALDAFDRIKERGEEPTRKAVKAEAGVGKTTVDEAFQIREAAEAAELPPLSMTAQQKLEAWQRKLESEFEHRVQVESKKRWEELGLPALEKRWGDLERMLKNPRFAIMTKREYNTIMRCLHPDSAKSRTDAQLNEAFNIFTGYKLKMINDEEERAEERRKLRSGMPSTVEEMVARKGAKGK